MNVSVGSLEEIKPDLKGLTRRWFLLGYDPIKVGLRRDVLEVG